MVSRRLFGRFGQTILAICALPTGDLADFYGDRFHFQIAVAVVNALFYLHANLKVIHRDVKPSNILINRRGQVKMCDFGISGNIADLRMCAKHRTF